MQIPDTLPISPLLPDIRDALEGASRLVLEAPPGAGKTTTVPLALLDAAFRAPEERLILLQPRRLAARMVAQRLAELSGSAPGQLVGWRMRGESKTSAQTRIEVVTTGVFLRMLQDDPSLEGIAGVIFDEAHERSLQSDLGLALALDAQSGLRDDLRLIVMSATLEAQGFEEYLAPCPVIRAEGRMYPVETRHDRRGLEGRGLDKRDAAAATAATCLQALEDEPSGSILAFLPGWAEIMRAAEELKRTLRDRPQVTVHPLHGSLPKAEQRRAIAPAPSGTRKIVLATSIAETSLTIDGIRIVVDAGLDRRARFNPNTGMSGLVTEPASRASCTQRAGRAGRLEPGICYRLWPAAAHGARPARTPPEIFDADLAPLALDLANWGVTRIDDLRWLDPPPPQASGEARALLHDLGAIDADYRITQHGQQMARLPVHPRLAHMLLTAPDPLKPMACQIAAVIEERDPIRRNGPGPAPCDIRLRLEALAGERPSGASVDKQALHPIREQASRLARLIGLKGKPRHGQDQRHQAGQVLALGWPDRIAAARNPINPGTPTPPDGRLHLTSGGGAMIDPIDPLATERFLAAAVIEQGRKGPELRLAAPIARAELETLFPKAVSTEAEISFDKATGKIRAREKRKLFGTITLHDGPLPNPDPEQIEQALSDTVRNKGLHLLNWSKQATNLLARLRHAGGLPHAPQGWPDFSDQALQDSTDDWLKPYLTGLTTLDDLKSVKMADLLLSRLDWPQRQALDTLTPPRIELTPGGPSYTLDYTQGEQAVLPVKLRDLFGLDETPQLGGAPVLLHILSPAGRPVQVTDDLPGFWRNTYHQVRAELRGKYIKHPWPDDPLAPLPERFRKKRR
ncbi:MAG: ATP-dependent helicase HrpB [Alphaproteobacteria bacterium]